MARAGSGNWEAGGRGAPGHKCRIVGNAGRGGGEAVPGPSDQSFLRGRRRSWAWGPTILTRTPEGSREPMLPTGAEVSRRQADQAPASVRPGPERLLSHSYVCQIWELWEDSQERLVWHCH